MNLSGKKLYLVISLAVVSMIGMFVVQYYLINSAHDNEEKKFYTDVKLIGIQLQNEIKSNSTLHDALIRLASNPNPDSSEIAFYKSQIGTIADSLFRKRNNTVSYEFGLVTHSKKQNDCCHIKEVKEEQVVFSTNSKHDESILQSRYHICASTLSGFAHINFFYPNLDWYLLRGISDIIILAILCTLIVAGCLAFALRAIREQKKLMELKNDFINNMTHEFKTPIFSISLASRILGKIEEVKNSKKAQEYLNLIARENKRLKSQVQKVLEIRSADFNNDTLEKEQVDLHQLIKKTVHSYDKKLSNTSNWLTLQLNAANPVIQADKTHLENIINNLLDNAIKYSQTKPEITIGTKNTENGIVFNIIDQGIGMDSETEKHVFDKFYRAQTGDVHRTKGFGLGLSYVKKMVEAHQGWIKLKSELKKGSTFTIFLPNQ